MPPASAESIDFDLPDLLPDRWVYRDYQVECLRKVEAGWQKWSRQLIVLFTGAGKPVAFAAEAYRTVRAGGRVLILAHTDELIDQAADKLKRSTGLDSEREKAEFRASLSAQVVTASIQTLSRVDRLTGFPANHFSLVIVDEAHLALAPTFLRVIRYFHFGADSLKPDWKPPGRDEVRPHFARILGCTATADRGDKRSLGELFQAVPFEFNLKQGCQEGWLVKPIVRQIPVKIDLKGVKIGRSASGADFDATEVMHRIEPFIAEMCRLLVVEIGQRKTMVFVPSVHIARMAAAHVNSLGVTASFVSGDCPDRTQKIASFRNGGPQVIFNALLLVLGFDFDKIACVSVWRPTKIRSFYAQCIGRGTRPLTGIVDACFGKAERLAAIAASAKPTLLILDPLWLSDRLDLVRPCDLVATRKEIRERMLKDDNPDLLQSEEEASVELLKSLQREAEKHAHKEARTIDPLAFAAKIKDDSILTYEESEGWEFLPPTDEQIAQLKKWGFNTSTVTTRGLATKLIDRKIARDKLGLCSPAQLNFLERMGYQNPDGITKERATAILVGHRKRWAEQKQRAREAKILP